MWGMWMVVRGKGDEEREETRNRVYKYGQKPEGFFLPKTRILIKHGKRTVMGGRDSDDAARKLIDEGQQIEKYRIRREKKATCFSFLIKQPKKGA